MLNPFTDGGSIPSFQTHFDPISIQKEADILWLILNMSKEHFRKYKNYRKKCFITVWVLKPLNPSYR